MFLKRTNQFLKLGWLFALSVALVAFLGVGSVYAHHGDDDHDDDYTESTTTTGCGPRTSDADIDRDADDAADVYADDVTDVTVDDVLDNPGDYLGKQVTLEGEVDHPFGGNTFEMEDDKDLFGEDEILVISVMPEAQADGELEEGNLVTATGEIRCLDRAALESEFGTIDWGTAPVDELEGQPVLVMGAREFAEAHRAKPVEEQAEVIEPEPMPEPAPAPEPEVVIEEEEVEVAPAPELPETATPLPAVGLAGLLSLAVGLGVRLFRR